MAHRNRLSRRDIGGLAQEEKDSRGAVQQGRGQPGLWGLWPIGCVFTGKCVSLLVLGSLIYRVWMSLPPIGPFVVT